MMFLSAGKPFRLPILSVWIALALGSPVTNAGAVEEIQFNTDVLDINDRKNIDLSQFTRWLHYAGDLRHDGACE